MWSYYHRQGSGALTMMIKPVGKKAKVHLGFGLISHVLPGMPEDQYFSLCGRHFVRRVPWAGVLDMGKVCETCVSVELK